jgi:hypothetical protein
MIIPPLGNDIFEGGMSNGISEDRKANYGN